jgi:hypothetical protein
LRKLNFQRLEAVLFKLEGLLLKGARLLLAEGR